MSDCEECDKLERSVGLNVHQLHVRIAELERERDNFQERLARILAAYSALRAGGNELFIGTAVSNLEEAFLFATRPNEAEVSLRRTEKRM